MQHTFVFVLFMDGGFMAVFRSAESARQFAGFEWQAPMYGVSFDVNGTQHNWRIKEQLVR